jgi:lipopolysaccharide export system protein LptA
MKKEWNYSIKPGAAMFRKMVKYILSIYLIIFSCSICALSSDKDQVMHVLANFADLSQQVHKGTYIGEVEFIQGTTNLRAAKAITQGDEKNQLILAVASGSSGKQAHFWTITDPKKPPFHAYADLIHYYPKKHIIKLMGHARVQQGANSFTAAKITYNIEKQQVISRGKGKQRITIIYYPEKKLT